MNRKRVWLYARSATGDMEAMENQMNRLMAYAIQEGYEIIGTSRESGNGLTLDRPELNKLKKLCKDKIDALLTVNLSRIGRNVTEVFLFESLLSKKGIAIETLNGDNTVPSEALNEIILRHWREEHSKKLSPDFNDVKSKKKKTQKKKIPYLAIKYLPKPRNAVNILPKTSLTVLSDIRNLGFPRVVC